jgi:hypothetical protein
MNSMCLRPLTEVEMKETEGGSILGFILGAAIGWCIGAVIYALASSDGECEE